MEGLENAGVQLRLIPPIIGITIISTVGIFCNTNVALTVVTSKNLRNVSNYLIALNSLADVGHQLSHFFTIYSVLSGTNVIHAKTCFIVMALPFLCLDFSMCIMIWIGLDRILRIVLLNRYDRINKKIYLAFIVATSNIYGFTLLYIAYGATIAAPDTKLLCVVVFILNGDMPRKILLYTQLAACVTCVLAYAVFWILFKSKHGSKLDDVTTKLVARSVSVIVAIVLICWVLTTLIATVAEPYLSVFDLIVMFFYMGSITDISFSSNFFVLYALK
ncbi:serpentine type 7TM GPCR chemoreceptor srsx domain-containing protein [Ditylenchus destructor]|uniref:Serpentine type 7TM GPCR chemoreceptor srsx domain-containing protein n=1 Tax=Ditylenchus destructor TaxID=166010 RepID=A0AAD4MVS8_9BILA|nr:serpentine type 7TM GPCR chemoreceptor srsx domain-containing protein [Ditylenchus destructor]